MSVLSAVGFGRRQTERDGLLEIIADERLGITHLIDKVNTAYEAINDDPDRRSAEELLLSRLSAVGDNLSGLLDDLRLAAERLHNLDDTKAESYLEGVLDESHAIQGRARDYLSQADCDTESEEQDED